MEAYFYMPIAPKFMTFSNIAFANMLTDK